MKTLQFMIVRYADNIEEFKKRVAEVITKIIIEKI